jgi:hypothetical protein
MARVTWYTQIVPYAAIGAAGGAAFGIFTGAWLQWLITKMRLAARKKVM